MTTTAAIAATNRFGLGAMPGELSQTGDPRGGLRAQLRVKPDMTLFANLPGSLDIIQRQTEYLQQRRRARNEVGARVAKGAEDSRPSMTAAAAGDGTQRTPLQQEIRRDAMADIALRYRIAANTTTPFVERLVHFWSNHFAISIYKKSARLLAAPMEREAI